MFDYKKILADSYLRFDQRIINNNRSQQQILVNWICAELLSLWKQKGEKIAFPESLFSQELPEAARCVVNIGMAQSMMPETGPGFTSDVEFDAWCNAYNTVGLSYLGELLFSIRDIRPTFEKERHGTEPTHEEAERLQAVTDAICSHFHDVEAARIEYTLTHRAELEGISPTIKRIFELYDRRAIGKGQ